MASPRASQELASVAVVVDENTESIISVPTYVTLCGVVHVRVYTAFENILSCRV